MVIRILTTGGTFDKKYNEIDRVMMIDSLDMTEKDRLMIAEKCLETPEARIVITHGTDTMVDTARILAGSVKEKTIVLTGAMIPYSFGNSDGMFNLGSVISFVQLLPHGVYIAMNGECFTWDNVQKNRELGRFEAIR